VDGCLALLITADQVGCQEGEVWIGGSERREQSVAPVSNLRALLHFLATTSESTDSRLKTKDQPEGPREQRAAMAAIRYDDLLGI